MQYSSEGYFSFILLKIVWYNWIFFEDFLIPIFKYICSAIHCFLIISLWILGVKKLTQLTMFIMKTTETNQTAHILNTEPLLCIPCLKQCYSIVSRWIIHTCNIYSKTACILVSVEVCGCVRDGYRSLFQHQCSVGISRRDLKSLDPCTVVAHTGSVVCDDSVSPKIHIPWAARYNRGSSIFKKKKLIPITENTINLYNIL